MKHLFVLVMFAIVASVSSVSAATVTANVAAELRSEAVTGALIGYVPAGTKLEVLEEVGAYSYVTSDVVAWGAKEGWTFRDLYTWEGDIGTAKQDTAFEDQPYPNGTKKVGAVKAGQKVKATKLDTWWFKVNYNGKVGWLFRTQISRS